MIKEKKRFCIAPMLKYTDRHCRYFHRIFTKKSFLYTEMMTTECLLNKKKKIYKNDDKHNLVAFQIAGNNSIKISKCAKIIYKKKFNEINLNIGCPSLKLTKNFLGVSLMKHTNIVINSINAINSSVPLPISIKTRIGIDNHDSYQFFRDFIQKTSDTNKCKIFIIHARKAILKNFSPKKNLIIPKLKYEYVYKLKKDFPQLNIIINGGIKSIKEIKFHLKKVNGVMMGRFAYQNPMFLKKIDYKIFKNKKKKIKIKKILKKMCKYAIKNQILYNVSPKKIFCHMIGLFKNKKGSKKWKRFISKFYHLNNYASIQYMQKKIKKIKF
ncbi:tRNA dihydrouridine(20/20a) synthase DusA [Buchnera aphidicola]|uniref:tRNA dihydrouridine(20/20a) synthase DusA n=1 Tax=Buchnera aphidicola TaxID=9 RepID=UPI0030EDE9B9